MTSRLDVFTAIVSDKTTWTFFKLSGDGSAHGVGEATIHGRADAVIDGLPDAVSAIKRTDLGLSAKLAATSAAVAGPAGRAIASGLEQAWFDRLGHRIGLPLHALIGGLFRRSVPTYANINRGTISRRPDEFAKRAAHAAAAGYTAVKLAPFDDVSPGQTDKPEQRELIEQGFARVSAVRAALPAHVNVQVDCHSRLDGETAARVLDTLASIGVSWFEEPIQECAEAMPLLVTLRAQAKQHGVLLAGAENCDGLSAFQPFLQAGVYDVVMPDIVLSGGLSEVVRIGHAAAAAGTSVSLHNPYGPVSDVLIAHVAAALPTLHSLERQVDESPLYDDLVERHHRADGGGYQISDAAGAGLSIDWQHRALELVCSFDVEI